MGFLLGFCDGRVKGRMGRGFQPSLRDLSLLHIIPALKRRAIVTHPYGMIEARLDRVKTPGYLSTTLTRRPSVPSQGQTMVYAFGLMIFERWEVGDGG